MVYLALLSFNSVGGYSDTVQGLKIIHLVKSSTTKDIGQRTPGDNSYKPAMYFLHVFRPVIRILFS